MHWLGNICEHISNTLPHLSVTRFFPKHSAKTLPSSHVRSRYQMCFVSLNYLICNPPFPLPRCCCRTNSQNPTKHLSRIPQYIIQDRNMHISDPNCAFWDMALVHCGICGISLYRYHTRRCYRGSHCDSPDFWPQDMMSHTAHGICKMIPQFDWLRYVQFLWLIWVKTFFYCKMNC